MRFISHALSLILNFFSKFEKLKQINEQVLAKLEERNAQLAEKERQLGAKNEKVLLPE